MLSQFLFILKIEIKVSFCPFTRHEVSVLIELPFGHLRYRLADVPPQPNSPPDTVACADRRTSFDRGLGLVHEIGATHVRTSP